MAYTKVFAIKARLDDRVKYVTNEEKTTLDAKIVYAVNPEKTEQVFFTDALNCDSVKTAFEEMQKTKQRFGKTDGVLGYHFIQSFAPGEITPERAHELGMEFAQRMFGDRYEVVVGTHLDKAHLHNHIVINSVSFVDGQKYHSSPESYYNTVRGTSDELCRENNLSVITPKGKGKTHSEWQAEKDGKPTIRGIIRNDIDRIIGEAYTYQTFLVLLQKNGYTIRSGNRKYTAVRPPGAKRFIRLDSLGGNYTEDAIRQRLIAQRGGIKAEPPVFHVKRYRTRGTLRNRPRKKLTGFQALYFRYVYLLRGSKRTRPHHRTKPIRAEVLKLEQYQKQFFYLMNRNITTADQLAERIGELEMEMYWLTEDRNTLYQERRNSNDESEKTRASAEIENKTAALRIKRQELNLCRKIQADIPRVQEAQEEQEERLKNKVKEERDYERKW